MGKSYNHKRNGKDYDFIRKPKKPRPKKKFKGIVGNMSTANVKDFIKNYDYGE